MYVILSNNIIKYAMEQFPSDFQIKCIYTCISERLMDLKNDEYYMELALRQAADASVRGEVPVGAVAVLDDGRVVARAYNQVEMLKDGTAHAEMIALTQASAALEDWRLENVTLYVTKEPCPMCAGAMVNCRLKRLVFGCSDARGGAAGGALELTNHPGLLHKVEVTSGVLADQCLELIQRFFRRRRSEKGGKTDIARMKKWLENLSMN